MFFRLRELLTRLHLFLRFQFNIAFQAIGLV